MSARLDPEYSRLRASKGANLGDLLDHLRNRNLDYDAYRRAAETLIRRGAIQRPKPKQTVK